MLTGEPRTVVHELRTTPPSVADAAGRWRRPWPSPAGELRPRGQCSAWTRIPISSAAGIPLAAASIAVFVASPWLDQRLVWCEWVGLAAALLLVDRLRGWRGELGVLLSAAIALAIAFHWTPQVLAYAMNAEPHVGLLVAAPIVLWDAIRLALPFWFAARLTADPLRAWLPAALLATALEAFVPAVFPWKLGYAQIAWPAVVQSADLFGPEVTTFVLFAHAGAVVWLVTTGQRMAAAGRGHRWAAVLVTRAGLVAVAVCGLNLAYGVAALAWWHGRVDAAPTLTVAVVQANPDDEDGLAALRELTRRCTSGGDAPDLACWPECSGGSYDARLESLADPDRVADLSRPPQQGLRPLPAPACPLLFGGTIYEGHPEKPRALHQSAILVDASERILGRSHKRHLMPFGEYVPGSGLYPDIRLHFPMQEEFTPGTEARAIAWDRGPRLGVLLCYEDMIPAAARALVHESAEVLVSLINGSAFTEPLTLAQHRLLAQLRAVECRRSLVRCAATGESCVVSPLGVVVAALPPHVRGTLVADVPLLRSTTLACRLGPAFPLACGAVAVGLAARRWRWPTSASW